MYQKSGFSKSGLKNVLLMSFMSICSVTCLGDLYCPWGFNGGYVDQSCTRLLGTTCRFDCNNGLVKTRDMVNCGIDGNWYPDDTKLCILPGLCPSTFNGGYVSPLCSRRSGARCAYYCNQGFSGTSTELTCGIYGNWTPDTNSACIKLDLCPAEFSGGSIDPSCSRLPGYSCAFNCNHKYVKNVYRLTCGEDGKWIQNANSACINSDDRIPTESRPASEGLIAGITTSVVIVIFIIAAIVVLKLKRSSVRKSTRNASVHTGGTPWRPRDNPLQNATTIREYNHVDVIGSTLSFGSPSYNGICAQSSVQGIAAISSNWSYREPPPSYRETQSAANELPPSYNDVVMDPTRFNLYT